jgi:hypothetical protein
MKICRARPQLVFTFNNRLSSTGWAVPQSVRYRIFRLQASYLSATSHTGRQSCRVKSLYVKRFWVQWCCCTVMQDKVVQWPVVNWYNRRWYIDSVLQGYSGAGCTMVQYCGGTVTKCCWDTVVQWYSGTVFRWYSDSVLQGYSGEMAHWCFSIARIQWYSGTLVH